MLNTMTNRPTKAACMHLTHWLISQSFYAHHFSVSVILGHPTILEDFVFWGCVMFFVCLFSLVHAYCPNVVSGLLPKDNNMFGCRLSLILSWTYCPNYLLTEMCR